MVLLRLQISINVYVQLYTILNCVQANYDLSQISKVHSYPKR